MYETSFMDRLLLRCFSFYVTGSCLSRWYGFADASNRKMHSLQLQKKNFFASVSTGEEKPFDFLRTLFGMLLGIFGSSIHSSWSDLVSGVGSKITYQTYHLVVYFNWTNFCKKYFQDFSMPKPFCCQNSYSVKFWIQHDNSFTVCLYLGTLCRGFYSRRYSWSCCRDSFISDWYNKDTIAGTWTVFKNDEVYYSYVSCCFCSTKCSSLVLFWLDLYKTVYSFYHWLWDNVSSLLHFADSWFLTK